MNGLRVPLRLTHFRSFYKLEARPGFARSSTTSTTQHTPLRYFHLTRVKMSGSTEKWTAQVVRKQFLDFFAQEGHTIGTWWGKISFIVCLCNMGPTKLAVGAFPSIKRTSFKQLQTVLLYNNG